MTETIFVTGATGEVGTHVISHLHGRAVQVRAGVRDPDRAAGRFGPDVEVVPFRFEERAVIDAALAGVDRLLLITPPPSLLPHELTLAEPVIASAAAHGVRHIVRLSSMWALHSPGSAHRVIEQTIEASGVPYTHLRPNIFMQNFSVSQRSQIRDQHGIFVSAGMGRVSFIDVRDIAAVAARVLTEPNHTNRAYTLTGPAALDYGTVAEILSQAIGQPIQYHALADAELRATLQAQGWQGDLIQYVSDLYGAVRDGKRAIITADVAQILGTPPHDFRTYTHDYADRWR